MIQLLQTIKSKLSGQSAIPAQATAQLEIDRRGMPATDPGREAVVAACTEWLCAAQDHSRTADGGVARSYSLLKGWDSSYPETTGYIIPTIIALAQSNGDDALRARARRMLDWCVEIQFPEGGFQGGKVDATPRVPVTFNTGQILLGLAAGAAAYGDERYLDAMHRAASWLRDTQDADGCWRKHPTPFAQPGEKAYETHVAWGMFEAERVAPDHGYGAAGLRQIDWALTKQEANGWFSSNCLNDPIHPLTHTIGYVLRGLLEGQLLSGRADLLAAAVRTSDSLLAVVGADGYLAGRLDRHFKPALKSVCLTGSVQIAHCLFIVHQLTGQQRYFDAGQRLNSYVRRSVSTSGGPGKKGGVKGSFPVDGSYGQWEYLNWAAKFCIDANLLETRLLSAAHA